MKLYGSPICPDCAAAYKRLAAEDISYEHICITASTAAMKEFLRLRDSETEIFAPVKAAGGIGIPFFVFEDGFMTLDEDAAVAHAKA